MRKNIIFCRLLRSQSVSVRKFVGWWSMCKYAVDTSKYAADTLSYKSPTQSTCLSPRSISSSSCLVPVCFFVVVEICLFLM